MMSNLLVFGVILWATVVASFSSFANDAIQIQISEIKLKDNFCTVSSKNELNTLYCNDLQQSERGSSSASVYLPAFSDNGDLYQQHFDLSSNQQILLKKSVYGLVIGAAVMGVMKELPEGITKWNDNNFNDRSLKDKWYSNISSGPVMDHDSFAVNWIGHPLSGAAYYTMARTTGLRPLESFIYSSLMSTLYWEYGLEATAEIPSIQDLIITPVVGSLMGELSYKLINQIDNNRGIFLGSKTFGSIMKVVLNPLDFAVKGPRLLLKPLIGDVVIRPTLTIRDDPILGFYSTVGIQLPMVAGHFIKISDQSAKTSCSLSNLPSLNDRAPEKLREEADALLLKGEFCVAARSYALIDLEYPLLARKWKVLTRILESLSRGGYFRSFFLELENTLLMNKGSSEVERWDYFRVEVYHQQMLLTSCNVGPGLYAQLGNRRLNIIEEGIFWSELYLKDYPTSKSSQRVQQLLKEMRHKHLTPRRCF
ncbi:MAG: DUF3943 domain-containing protein [Bdellovibrionales bacterium]|jgi:hypothetical protein|nr:DUF3943 domain-containing protein [Bdellovibrionales bacterium]MBT3524761.1 DUF3943 domain-containing protein [Bdellovibrionales bacterium]MBT7669334.1 DUF3943 domain-containing protein [Bdellovibrionales bacterium]MBT7767648.1 DUF3943 domain-containing protein [Bdellovibrionales bacterium]